MSSGFPGLNPTDAAGFHGALAIGEASKSVAERGVLARDISGPVITGDNAVLLNFPPELLAQLAMQLRQQATQADRPAVTEIFRVLRQADEAPRAFFDSLSPNARLVPYDNKTVPYLPNGRGSASTIAWLRGKLGRLLVLVGRRGAGKTREVAELARELCLDDWTVCLAQLSHRHRMGPAESLLVDTNLVFVVDDLHKHSVRLSEQQRDYWDRLHAFLKPYFDTPGLKVRVVLTTLPEADNSHLPPPGHPLAKGMTVCELPDFEVSALQSLLRQMAENAGIGLSAEILESLAQQSDRTPKTIVANVERALRRAAPINAETWTQSWEGRWTEEFTEARLQQPQVPAVFRALYLLRRAGIPERVSYAIGLAGRSMEDDPRPAVDLMVESGLLALREGRLIDFGEEQLTSCLASLGEPLPALNKHWDAVISTVVEGAEHEPDWLSDMAALAEMLLDAELWEKAESVATTALGHDPGQRKHYIWRSIARFHLMKLAETEQDATSALEMRPEDAKAAVLRGSVRLLRGEYAGAETDLTTAIQSGDRKALYGRATARMQLGMIAAAESDFTELLNDDPKNLGSLRLRGYLRFSSGDFSGAVSDYSAALEIEPLDKGSLLMRGLAYMRMEEFQPMAADMSALIAQRPSALYHGLRGVARGRLGEVDQAIEDLSAALAAWEQDPMSRLMPKLALAAAEVKSGRKGVSDELLRELAVGFASQFGLEAGDANLASTDFLRDWMKRHWVSQMDGETAANLGIWAQPGAAYQTARAELYFQKSSFVEAEADYEAAMAQGLDKTIGYEWVGRARMMRGDLAGAEAAFSQLVALAPESSTAYFLRGAVRADRMATGDALSDLRIAQEKGNEAAVVFGLQGVCLFRLGRLEEAETPLMEAVKRDGRYAVGHYLLGAICVRRNDFGAGIQRYDLAVDCGLATPEVLVERAFVHVNLGNLEAAQADAERARQGGGGEAVLAPLLAQLDLAKGEYAAAEERCTGAIAAGPVNLLLFVLRAKSRFFQEKFPEAEADYTKAMEGGMSDVTAFAERGWSRLQQEKLEGALEDLDQAVALQPENPNYRRWRARIRRGKDDFAGVLEDLAIVFERGDVEALDYFVRGAAHLNLGDAEAAKADFDKAGELGIDGLQIRLFRSIARFDTNDYAGAIEDSTAFIEQNAEVPVAYQVRAVALIYHGQTEEALADCDRAAELEPDSALTHQCRGFYQIAKENYPAAIECFQAELAAGSSSEVRFRLGLAFHLAGQPEESLAEYSAGLPGATGADKRKALRDLDHWRERLRSEGAGTEANACEIRRLLSEETAGSRPGQ